MPKNLTENPILNPSMKIQVQLLPSPPRSITTKSGPRLVFTGISGDDVLHLSFPESVPAPKAGVDTLLTGAYLPARRAGDLPSFWVRA